MKKQVIIVILIFLVIVIIGIGIYYFNHKTINQFNNQQSGQQKQSSENVSSQVKKLNCLDILDSIEKDKCLIEVAELLNSGDSSACDSLTSEIDKITCRQSFVVKEVIQGDDLAKCNEIIDKSLAVDCLAQASFSLAIQKKDKKYCENIINETDRENCLKVLTEKLTDTDNDGLSDFDEINKYFTNPKNPDTDGDGYKDGEEVKNGFDPNK